MCVTSQYHLSQLEVELQYDNTELWTHGYINALHNIGSTIRPKYFAEFLFIFVQNYIIHR